MLIIALEFISVTILYNEETQTMPVMLQTHNIGYYSETSPIRHSMGNENNVGLKGLRC